MTPSDRVCSYRGCLPAHLAMVLALCWPVRGEDVSVQSSWHPSLGRVHLPARRVARHSLRVHQPPTAAQAAQCALNASHSRPEEPRLHRHQSQQTRAASPPPAPGTADQMNLSFTGTRHSRPDEPLLHRHQSQQTRVRRVSVSSRRPPLARAAATCSRRLLVPPSRQRSTGRAPPISPLTQSAVTSFRHPEPSIV